MNRIVFLCGLVLTALATLACGLPSLPLPSLARVEPTATARPTRTARPTFTATPTETNTPTRTPTSTKTNTPVPTETFTPVPPTDTPVPPTATNTRRPVAPTATFTPAPPPPSATPVNEFTGTAVDVRDTANCGTTPVIAIRVVDRAGQPLKGYIIHIGKDGSFSDWTFPTTDAFKTLKNGYAYNAEYGVGASKWYVTVFRQKQDTFNIGDSLSNEVPVRIDDKDDEACAISDGKSNGDRIRIAAVTFVYNR